MTALRQHVRIVAALAGIAGLALFVVSLRAAGTAAVVEGVRRVGAGFLAVFVLGGVRHFVRTCAWLLCFDDGERPSTRHAFGAYVAGDALGNITPFGFLISEPSK